MTYRAALLQRWGAIFAALAAGQACAPEYTDQDPSPVVAEALEEWMDVVGVLRPNLVIDVRWQPGRVQGDAVCWRDGSAAITLYQGSFEADGFEDIVRHVMRHELAHVHLTCSDADHSKVKWDLMYPSWTPENLFTLPDRDKCRERWVR